MTHHSWPPGDPGQLELRLLQFNFGTDQLVLQFHDYPVLDLLSLVGHIVPLFIDIFHHGLQPLHLFLTFIVKLLIILHLLDHFSQPDIVLVHLVQLLLDLQILL